MDILKRELAPITAEAWQEIDRQAARVLKTILNVRRLVEFRGPHGWDFSAVSEGRIEKVIKDGSSGLEYGIRVVKPLVESRVFFELDIWEIDSIVRGAADVDLSPLEQAAERAAIFEERAVIHGLPEGGIEGLTSSTAHKPLPAGNNGAEVVQSVARGVNVLLQASIEGPYGLLVAPAVWQMLAEFQGSCLGFDHLKRLLNGPVLLSPLLEGALLVSLRGGDSQLIVGEDFSIGYHRHTVEKVQLFFTESFTFKIIEPKAVLVLR